MNGYNEASDAIKALSQDERIAMLESQATQLFKTDRWSGVMARMLDLQPRTVANWRNGTTEPPIWALMLLKSLNDADRLKQFHRAYVDLQAAATQLGKT